VKELHQRNLAYETKRRTNTLVASTEDSKFYLKTKKMKGDYFMTKIFSAFFDIIAFVKEHKTVMLGAVAILFALLFLRQCKQTTKAKENNKRNQSNVDALYNKISSRINSLDQKIQSNRTLYLTYSEAKEIGLKDEIAQIFDEKFKNITQYSKSGVIWHKKFEFHLKDSIIYDTVKTQCFDVKDRFWQISGCDGFEINATHHDTLYQIMNLKYDQSFLQKIIFWKKCNPYVEQQFTTADSSSNLFYHKTYRFK